LEKIESYTESWQQQIDSMPEKKVFERFSVIIIHEGKEKLVIPENVN
jgi:hypothetical protein